jgi:predicted CoA-substrate-specific enzyme activase
MIAVGMDLGSLYSKVVVLRDGVVAATHEAPAGTDERCDGERLLREALRPLGAAPSDAAAVVATGAGRSEVAGVRERVAEVLAAARGARHLVPGACGVLDLGGESTRAARLDARGDVVEFAVNDKCASGTGVFLDAMAKLLGLPLEEMGPLSLTSRSDLIYSSTCVVFAESEVVSAIHRQTPRPDILRGIHRAIAQRVAGLVGRLGLAGDCVAAGGLARNVGIVACLEEFLGHKWIVPPQPQLVTALGAALLAADRLASPPDPVDRAQAREGA